MIHHVSFYRRPQASEWFSRPTNRRAGALVFRILPLVIAAVIGVFPNALQANPEREREEEIDLAIEGFLRHLGISCEVTVAIVLKNPSLVSVESVGGRADTFRMTFEEGFIGSLSTNELRAAVAHEVGHIWIFTHFPYLHTELLANQEALKLVPRHDLEKLYSRIWDWKGRQGDLDVVLGRSRPNSAGADGTQVDSDQGKSIRE